MRRPLFAMLCFTTLLVTGCWRAEAPQARMEPPPDEISTEELLTYRFVGTDGKPVGPVHGVVMDTESGTAEYVIVILEDKYHFGKGAYWEPQDKFLLIPWSHLRLDTAHWILAADVDAAILAQAPVLDDLPDTAPSDWDAAVRHYWADQ